MKAASSSSSFSGFSPSMPVPLCEFSTSFDSTVVTSVAATSTACSVAFASSLAIVSAQPFVSHNVCFSGEQSQKRRRED